MVFLTIPWFLPAYRAGGPIQSIKNLIENFTEDVEYRIFCGDADLNGESLTDIKKNEWREYNTNTKVWYAEKENRSNVICNEIALLKPDVLFIIGLFSWHFNIVPMLFCKANRKIISVRGMLHSGALSQKSLKKRMFLTAIKTFGISKKNIFHATDAKEKQYIKKEFGAKAKTVVAGNFSKKLAPGIILDKLPDYLTLVTIALISPMKNHLIVLEALHKCTAYITYNIYGLVKDEGYWQKCLNVIKLLPSNITVKYHGEVHPNLVSDILLQQHVFIMPSKSENFGHAIAEALSAGKPVITSNYTPWNNLEKNNAGINVHFDIEEIARAISFFATQNLLTYVKFTKDAALYSEMNLNTAEKIKGYKYLFLGENIQ